MMNHERLRIKTIHNSQFVRTLSALSLNNNRENIVHRWTQMDTDKTIKSVFICVYLWIIAGLKSRFFSLKTRLVSIILSLIILTSCTPTNTTPPRLYVFDVTDLHLNHYAYCQGPCSPESDPPGDKTFVDLLDAYDRLIFLSSLQGIVNKTRPQLYLIHHPTDRFWLETYQTPNTAYGWLPGTEIIELSTFEAVLDTVANDIDGLVAWDSAVPATLNVATTIAGVESWPIVRHQSALYEKLHARWQVKQSLVGKFEDNLAAYEWAIAQYLNTGRANYKLLAYLEDGWPAMRYAQNKMTRGGVYALERDYVIQQGGFAFDLSPWHDEAAAEAEMLSQIMQAARREAGLSLIKMWGFIPWYEKYASEPGQGGSHHPVEGEWESTWLFSYYASYLQGGGGDAWGAAMANISVHRFAPMPEVPAIARPEPTTSNLITKQYLLPDGTVNPDITFVLFYAGDYDLVHPTMVALADWERSTWVNAGRGEIPLAWGINPGMEEEIPGIMTYLLARRSENDYLVAANSGAGYINPQGLSRRYRRQWLTRSARYYEKYGLTVQGFLLNGRGYDLPPEWIARFAKLAPDGIISPDFEIVEAWPRLVGKTPFTGMTKETLGDSVPGSAENVHVAYRRLLAEDRPPFLAIRSSFQSPKFLADVYAQIQADDVAGEIVGDDGAVLHPNYILVDPYTFFALLEIKLAQ